MKAILLQILAILCTFAGIYFDRTLPIIGGILLFYAYYYVNNYYEEPKINKYIQIFFLLMQFGLTVYAVCYLLKSSLASLEELLGTQSDFINCVILFAFYFALSRILRKYRNILQKYINQ